jgi:hypothetical protein
MWFRIELNSDHSVKSCVEADRSVRNRVAILYIEASSKEEALRIVRERYERKLRYDRERKREARERAMAEGVCLNCKGAIETERSGRRYCVRCAQYQLESKAARKLGIGLNAGKARTDSDKVARLGKQREAHLRRDKKRANNWLRAKRTTFASCLEAFDQMTANSFRAWLVEQLNTVQEKERACEQRRQARRLKKVA